MRFRIVLVAALAFCLAPMARAADQVAMALDCLAAQPMSKTQEAAKVIECIAQAHAACLSEPPEASTVAALCFHEARDAWGAGIQELLKTRLANAPETQGAAVRINLKYNLMSALLQCDRNQELSVATSSDPSAVIQRQKAECEANASAMAWVQLRQNLQDKQ